MKLFNSTNVLLKHIVTISHVMNWPTPPIFTGTGYYFTWGDKTEEDVAEIFERTGIECKLAGNTLMVPEYSDFKSEKQKKLLLDLSQYGVFMMMLDLAKKSSVKDLKQICTTLFSKLYKILGEEEGRKLVEEIIDKIS